MAHTIGRNEVDIDDIPEIIPLNEYNFKKAKLRASLGWIGYKAYHGRDVGVPEELLNPFFKDEEGHDNLKPSVINQLASGELYSLACSNIFPPSIHPWRGHASVIQALSRKGIYVLDEGEPVSEVSLTHTQRIKLSSHQAMIGAIMKAYTKEVVSVEAVVKAVRQIATFNASSELPFDQEDALLFWINKVCSSVKHRLERERKAQQEQLMQSAQQMVRLRRDQLHPKQLPFIPVLDDLMKDISDGCCLAVLVSHYCPHLLPFEDIVLRENMSFADSLHNLQLLKTFFKKYLPETFHFTFEDLLYTHDSLKPSIIAFCSELFYVFEVTKPDHLSANQLKGTTRIVGSPGVSLMRENLPISDVTKRSFHHGAGSPAGQNSRIFHMSGDVRASNSPSSQQQRLLPGRQQKRSSMVIEGNPPQYQDRDIRRSTSLEDLSPDKPVAAWQTPEIIRSSDMPGFRNKTSQGLLANVSMDSEAGESQTFLRDADVGHSQETYLVASNQRNLSKEGKPIPVIPSTEEEKDDPEVTALTSRTFTTRMSSRDNHHSEHFAAGGDAGCKAKHAVSTHERLGFQPLDLPPAGITTQSADARKRMRLDLSPADTKSQSLGNVPKERLMPSPGRTSKEVTQSASKVAEYGEKGSKSLPLRGHSDSTDAHSMISWEQRLQNDQKTTPESVDSSTPLSGETVIDTFALKDEVQRQNARKKWANKAFQQAEQVASDGTPQITKTKHGEAFFVSHDPRTEMHPTNPQETGKSFVLSDKDYDEHSAQQAGIPVVVTSLRDLNGSPDYEEKWHHQDLTHPPNNMQFVANPALSVTRSAHDPHSHLKANHSPANFDRVSVASDSAMFLHARSRSPRHFFLSDYSPPSQVSGFNMDATNEGRVNGSLSCNPMSASDLACSSDESPKLHAELLESETGSKLSHNGPDVYPVEGLMLPANLVDGDAPVLSNGMADPQDTSQSDSGDLQFSDLTSITSQNVHMHEQFVVENDDTKDHMITWLTNSKPAHTSNTINSGPDAAHGVPSEPAPSELALIRMQLEKKRRHFDHEKRKLERHWHKQRMKVNKEAFLQCVTKKKPEEPLVPQGRNIPNPQTTPLRDIYPTSTKITFADISAKKDKQAKLKEDLKAFSDSSQSGRSATDSGSNRSGSPTSSAGSHSPQLTNEEYNASLEKLNANLSELQSQITRLSLQQEQQLKSSQLSPRSNTSDLLGGTDVDGRTYQVAGYPENSPMQDHSVDASAQMGTWLKQSPRPIGPIVQNQEEFRNLRSSWIEQSNLKDGNQQDMRVDPNRENEKFAKTFTVEEKTVETPDSSQVDSSMHAPVKMEEALPNREEAQSGKKQMYMEINLSPEKKVPPKPKLSVKSKPAPSEKRTVNQAEGESKDVTEEVMAQEAPGAQRKDDVSEVTSSSASDDKPVGFVVEMADQKDDEMAKRREVFLKAQLKRQEMERKKRAAREEEIEKQREERRKKQEEVEQKKADEKARREQIMQEYQQRKKREQDGEPDRPSKPKAKSRPKSRVIADSSNAKQPVLSGSEPVTPRVDTADSANSIQKPSRTITTEGSDETAADGDSTSSSSAFSKIKADKTFRALPDKQGPRITPKKTPSPESPAKNANGSATSIKRSGSFKGSSSNRPPSPGRSSPGRRSPSPRPPSPMMQRRRSNTLPGSLTSEDLEEGDKTAASGPKLYVRPTSRSNKNLICNAISHCVLAGVPNIPQRDKVLEEVNKSDHKHFVILFRDQGLQFRAVYGFNPETEEMTKVYGTGPRHITNKMLENIYKYDSGSKKFSKIHSKTMSVQVDGLIIGQMYWQSKKTSAKR